MTGENDQSQKTEDRPQTENPDNPGSRFEEGLRRKFLCVVDDSPECNTAVYYAARRARHVGGTVSLLYVIEPGDFQHWASVKEAMAEEARAEAEEIVKAIAERVQDVTDHPAEIIIREGKLREEILAHIAEDDAIAILVLGAASGKNGPGPLVASLAGRDQSSQFPIPVLVVPGALSADDIRALS